MGVRLHNGKGITKGVGALPLNSVECAISSMPCNVHPEGVEDLPAMSARLYARLSSPVAREESAVRNQCDCEEVACAKRRCGERKKEC